MLHTEAIAQDLLMRYNMVNVEKPQTVEEARDQNEYKEVFMKILQLWILEYEKIKIKSTLPPTNQ